MSSNVPFICRDKFKADEEEKELKKEQRDKEKENTSFSSEEERSTAIIPAGKETHRGCCSGIAVM